MKIGWLYFHRLAHFSFCFSEPVLLHEILAVFSVGQPRRIVDGNRAPECLLSLRSVVYHDIKTRQTQIRINPLRV